MKSLFEIATPELVEKLFKYANKKTYNESEVIFSEGEKAEFLPIVLTGKVKLVRYPEIGKEFIISFFESGEAFAIPPAMDGKNYPATCIASETTKLLLMPRHKFLDLMRESSEFSSFMLDKMCVLLRESAETISNLANSSPERRVGKILLRLLNPHSPKINLRRQDIADMAGLTTETTIRVVKKLEEKDLLKIQKGKIIVEHPQLLREYLD